MRRYILLAVLAVGLIAVPAASASASPYLSGTRAKMAVTERERSVGHLMSTGGENYYGSGVKTCARRSRSALDCRGYILLNDDLGTMECTGDYYVYRLRPGITNVHYYRSTSHCNYIATASDGYNIDPGSIRFPTTVDVRRGG